MPSNVYLSKEALAVRDQLHINDTIEVLDINKASYYSNVDLIGPRLGVITVLGMSSMSAREFKESNNKGKMTTVSGVKYDNVKLSNKTLELYCRHCGKLL